MYSPTDPGNTSQDESSENDSPRFQGALSSPMHSPTDDTGARTPPRVMSSTSLYGEDLLISSRPSSGPTDTDFLFSPSMLSDSEATTPPSIRAPLTLSPPPINGENVSWASASAPRRPPRAPNVSLRFGGGSLGGGVPKQATHRRGASGGDASFMSALTDSDYEAAGDGRQAASQFQPTHGRHVSWDKQESSPAAAAEADGMNIGMNIDIDIPLDLQQPILDDIFDGGPIDGLSELPPHRDRSLKKPHKHPGGHRRIFTGMSEFETEAETLILKAIESETESKERRASFRANIYPTIPNDAVHPFETAAPDRPPMTETDEDADALESSRLHKAAIRLEALLKTSQSSTNVVPETVVPTSKTQTDSWTPSSERLITAVSVMKLAVSKRKPKASVSGAGPDTNEDASSATEGDAVQDGEIPVNGDIEAGINNTTGRLGRLATSAKQAPHKGVDAVKLSARRLKEDWGAFEDFVQPQKTSWRIWIKNLLLCIVAPSILLASLLYYAFDNPPTGKSTGNDGTAASASWWVIFLGARVPLVLGLSKGTEIVLVQYSATQSPLFFRLMGSRMVLFFSHSKGWPAVSVFFGFYSLIFLYGKRPYKKHWLYWQTSIDMFNENNPAGDITSRDLLGKFVVAFIIVGITVTLKRMWTGLHLGRRLFIRYSDQLTSLMQEMSLIGEIALLCRQTPNVALGPGPSNGTFGTAQSEDVVEALRETKADTGVPPPVGTTEREPAVWHTPQSTSSQSEPQIPEVSSRIEIMDQLEQWEEPERLLRERTEEIGVKDILQFRRACLLMETAYPFSPAFGPASTRKACIVSAQRVYGRLLDLQDEGDVLSFETIAAIALQHGGMLDRAKIKKLACVFRPDNTGMLSLVDWCKSVDSVYKKNRLLSSSIQNATQIDRAYEHILNVAFYICLALVIFAILGISALEAVLSLSAVLVAFAFMIGSASASYFEGILLILVRRPYDIGDRIAVSDINIDTNTDGSKGWIVQEIDIFTTTVRFVASREVATLSNGSLARSRIINMSRSDKAQVFVYVKFSVDEPYSKVKVFNKAVEAFVHERPREWLTLVSLRATRVEIELGYIEYVVVLQHQEAWNKVTQVLESKAAVSSFCLEVQKQLGMRYTAPPLPVDLAVGTGSRDERVNTDAETELPFPQEVNHATSNESTSIDPSILAMAKLFETKKTK